MRIRLSLTLDIDRAREPEEEQFEHRDNDGTLVETTGPQRIGFRVDHGAEPYGPDEDRRRR